MNLYEHRVQYYETDKMGIVHHSNYVRWMEEARTDFLSRIGWAYDKLEDMGIISPVTAVDCKYKVTTTYADAVVCEARSEHCFLNKEGKIISLKRAFPEVYEAWMQLPQGE